MCYISQRCGRNDYNYPSRKDLIFVYAWRRSMKITKIAAIKVSALVVCNVVSVVAPHDAIAPAVNVLVWGSIEICINNRKPKDEK